MLEIYNNEYDIDADWHINKECNFQCPYCYLNPGKNKDSKLFLEKAEIESTVKAFDDTGLSWHITILGGEPFLYPRFIDLCAQLTRKHGISIVTNLSCNNLSDFCRQVVPEKVESFYCSLNLPYREVYKDAGSFIDKVNILRKNKFNLFTTQVMWPPIIQRFIKLFDLFAKEGVIVRPMLFRGFYRKKKYPEAYNSRERRLFFNLSEKAKEMDTDKHKEGYRYIEVDRHIIKGELSFKGSFCAAGKEWVLVDINGDVFRCGDDRVRLGNIYQGKIKFFKNSHICNAEICRCARLGILLSEANPKIKPHTLFRYLVDNLPGKKKLSGVKKILAKFYPLNKHEYS